MTAFTFNANHEQASDMGEVIEYSADAERAAVHLTSEVSPCCLSSKHHQCVSTMITWVKGEKRSHGVNHIKEHQYIEEFLLELIKGDT